VCFASIVGTEAVDVLRVRRCGCDDALTPGGSPAILVPENIVSIVTVVVDPEDCRSDVRVM
jgi:hypothetical protein